MWVWATPLASGVVRNPSGWSSFFDFCDAPHENAAARINAIYLEPPLDMEQADLRAFLAAAHERGLRVEFLFGERGWQAQRLEGAKRACSEVVEAPSASKSPAERFDGIHLDLETAGQWSQRAFRDLLAHLRSRVDSHKATGARRMTLAADLGFWWAGRGDDSTPQYPDAIALCDYVLCMAYRDTAGAQVSCAVPEALAAARRRKGFYIGAETQHLADQDYVTYYEEGWDHMEAELAKLPSLLARQGGALSGVAIHHYDSYVRMSRQHRVSPFPDVRLDFWAQPAIAAAQAAGIVGGYVDGTFRPTEPVRRDDIAVFISHALVGRGNLPAGPASPSFPDVPAGYWAYRHIEWGKAHAIIGGCADGLYHPAEPVNRGQMALFVARAMVTPTGDAGLAAYAPPTAPTFPDVRPDNEWRWCHQHVEYLASQGIAQAQPDGLFHPEHPGARDQVAVYLAKALKLAV